MKDYPLIAIVFTVLLLSFGILSAQSPIQQVVFENVFSAITTAQASAPFRNIGQAMHTLQVTFPDETTTISGIDIVLQFCSRDCDSDSSWRPMGTAVTQAPVLDGGIIGVTDVYAYGTYYGVFRAVRANMATNTPGGAELTARYAGAIIPVIPFVSLQDDRWVF